ncbi:PAS domain-containing sensor histidine kinase [Alkalihalobacillus sp. BA299]|uniref:sensor histidine kinase n=1 Tax=Alkalihalobacillus sp. BA299 TaxID=2815938 RepID=UPI001ADCB563|nr:PAS domain-containing sensor histidine kinase [Alkalihalobacillus sp. BA299]
MEYTRPKLIKRYLLITLIVCISSLTTVYLITVKVLNSSVMEEVEYRNQLMAKMVAHQTNFYLEQMINDIRGVSSFVLEERNNKEVYLDEMKNLVIKNPLYFQIKAFNNKGENIVSVPEVNLPNPPEFEEVLERLKWSKTHYISNVITMENGQKNIVVAYPAINNLGEYEGGVIAFISLNTLSQYLSQIKIGEQGVNVLIDRAGTIVGHNNESFIGYNLKDHTLTKLLNKSRIGTWEGYLFNEMMLLAYRPTTLGGFGIVVGESKEQVMMPITKVQTILLKSFVVVLFLTILLTVIGVKRVINPINELIKQAKEYKERKRSEFQLIETEDELQELSFTMHEMAQELINKEKRMSNILEAIPYAVITTDATGNIVTFNKGAEDLILYERSEVKGKSILELHIRENDNKKNSEFISWKTFNEGKEFEEIEGYILGKDGVRRDVRVYSAWFNYKENKNIGMILILRDVSELKKMEEQLKQSERLASLGQLTAGIAHEIKNPLSIIQAAAEAIQLEVVEETASHHLIHELSNDILETTDRLNKTLTEFLKMSKKEKCGKKEVVNLVSMINELLTLLRKRLEEQNVKVFPQFKGLCEFDVNVYANENQLIQVFLNIILNSLQAMENGGDLIIHINEDEYDWEVIIEDTGKGIPTAEIKWIFDPFFTTKNSGTGLGLSIAYENIIQNNGRIRAESKLDEGTSITINLPKWNKEVGQANEFYIIS